MGRGRVDDERFAGIEKLFRPHRRHGFAILQGRQDAHAMLGFDFVDAFLQQYVVPPARIILDVDATNLPLHGHQLGRFFHGYYDEYCYLPLYIFCGDHPLRLLPAVERRAADERELDQQLQPHLTVVIGKRLEDVA